MGTYEDFRLTSILLVLSQQVLSQPREHSRCLVRAIAGLAVFGMRRTRRVQGSLNSHLSRRAGGAMWKGKPREMR